MLLDDYNANLYFKVFVASGIQACVRSVFGNSFWWVQSFGQMKLQLVLAFLKTGPSFIWIHWRDDFIWFVLVYVSSIWTRNMPCTILILLLVSYWCVLGTCNLVCSVNYSSLVIDPWSSIWKQTIVWYNQVPLILSRPNGFFLTNLFCVQMKILIPSQKEASKPANCGVYEII